MEINEEALNTTAPSTPYLGGWNWGAAFLGIPWGIGNQSYLTLLSLVPVLNFVWWIVCGIKGNKWAWESGMFENAETFEATQRTWNRAGITMFVLAVIGVLLYIIFGAAILALVGSSYSPSTY